MWEHLVEVAPIEPPTPAERYIGRAQRSFESLICRSFEWQQLAGKSEGCEAGRTERVESRSWSTPCRRSKVCS